MDINKSLRGVPKTLLISLKARAYESMDPKGLIRDQKSIDIAKALGCTLDNPKEISLLTRIGTGKRTLVFDDYTGDFLRRFPDGTIVNLACGLDTRFKRLDNGKLRWFDLDLPETIAIRRQFFKESERYQFIEKSVLDFSWTDDIPKDKPVLITAEGLFCYFTETEVRSILKHVAKTIPYAEFIIESIAPFMVKNSNKHPDVKHYDAPFKWAVNSGEELNAWQTGFRFVDQHYFMSECKSRDFRVRLMCLIPMMAKCMKIFRLVNAPELRS